MIANHYLTIRKWCPSFQPEEDAIKNLAVWATLNLSIEYFDQPFLERLGSKIGRIVKVDKTTSWRKEGSMLGCALKWI